MVAVCQCLLKTGIFLSSLPCLQCIVITDGENSRYAEDLLSLCKYKSFIWFCLTVVFILQQYLEIYTYKTFLWLYKANNSKTFEDHGLSGEGVFISAPTDISKMGEWISI